MKKVINENLLKLRELSDEICAKYDYDVIINHLKDVIEKGKENAKTFKTANNKIKCYETMCLEITEILKSIK